MAGHAIPRVSPSVGPAPTDVGLPAESILRDFSTEKLGAAVELNSAEWLRLESELPWVEFHEDSDAIWMFAGDTWPRNTVALARFTPATAYRRIREILSHHLAHKAACNWIVGPLSAPADLGKHLRAHGFSCRIHCAGMACDLNDFPSSPPLPPGGRICLVEEPPMMVPLTTELRRRRHLGRRTMALRQPKKVWCFSAMLDDVPVGETMLCAGAGVAGIYNVEVLEKFRRQGFGSALLHAALSQARELGLRIAVLSATGMGHALYTRFNFREVCKLSYLRRKKPE
jgi:GNAT superfamily N-acetyltransferase